ncbi:hypothetical protein AK812_SmicGene48930, partial [Symbiodinium microadriaticum]
EPGHCSLWLCADAPVLENIRLRREAQMIPMP